jgi:hypothetical protein
MRIFRSTLPFTGKVPGYLPVALFLFLHLITPASADGTVSIAAFTSYIVQRLCVKDCLWGGQPGGGVNLPGYLPCPAPFSDSCMCRTDLAVTASTFLSSCVGKFCSSNSVDISSAIDLYSSYCDGKLAVVTSAALLSIESFKAYSTARIASKIVSTRDYQAAEQLFLMLFNVQISSTSLQRMHVSRRSIGDGVELLDIMCEQLLYW